MVDETIRQTIRADSFDTTEGILSDLLHYGHLNAGVNSSHISNPSGLYPEDNDQIQFQRGTSNPIKFFQGEGARYTVCSSWKWAR